MHIRQGRRGHARRECGSIQFMVRVQDESNIKSALGRGGRFGAIQLQQKIGCVRDIDRSASTTGFPLRIRS